MTYGEERASDSNTLAGEKKIYIIHENSSWIAPLRDALDTLNYPYEEWFVNDGTFNLQVPPPDGVFYNRMSASSHTRDHRYAVELAEPILAWLEAYGRKVVNDRRALQLETRKIEQYIALGRYGIKTPHTIAAVGKEHLLEAAREFGTGPFIVKPNRGGKGTGVTLYQSVEELETALESFDEWTSLDGINLVQQYVQSPEQAIHRLEFIGGKFYYAVRVDASNGFELCPAVECTEVDNASVCPADANESGDNKFEILEEYSNPDLLNYERFLAASGIQVAAIEYITDAQGQRFVYDVNINTNYNVVAEAHSGLKWQGMHRIAEHLGHELEKINQRDALIAEEAAYAKTLFTA